MLPTAAYLCAPFRPTRTCLSFPHMIKWSSVGCVRSVQRLSYLLYSNTAHLNCRYKFRLVRPQVQATTFHLFHTSLYMRQAEADQSSQKNEQLISQMSIRLVNENSFLSWCRNAYLSTVVGVAMMAEGASALAQSAGLGALLVGTMNLAWGTGCHVTNLVRLRHVSGMSGLTLFLHLVGSSLHCILWAFVLICYIGFLDESRQPAGDEDGSSSGSATSKRKLGDGLPRI
ncbi:hypothetical protein RRG08_026693 [Elysia crispata]|uniref:Uncharacterized protein n=1 Tax=Elysia crispata TaxID=231223 RepID=A0AAE1E860_9GAST|nr:hypothetical protein RRG08_026693 [Elysia crispata]